MGVGKRTGRVALVTGGAQGIGQGIARWLLDAGMTVVIADIDSAAAEEWIAEMGRPEGLHAVTADVTREDDVRHMIEDRERNRYR